MVKNRLDPRGVQEMFRKCSEGKFDFNTGLVKNRHEEQSERKNHSCATSCKACLLF